ncbi:MAG TPA: hypothetical protein VK465_13160 [Fibrobacteria bacterium]|nr:hypothetical protein [Fibrobacteria bacterium]
MPRMPRKSRADNHGHAILEHGDLFFFYHPKLEREVVTGAMDVASFHLVLHPLESAKYRYLAVSLKGLLRSGGEAGWWARIEALESRPEHLLRRLRDTHPLPPARPCGEGVYAVVRHGRHTHLAYALELPEEPGEVQKELGIGRQENPFLAIRNPMTEAREEAGLSPQVVLPDYPPDLLGLFGDCRFHPADPARLLDYEGVEILIARRPAATIEELGVDLHKEHETRETAELFRTLKMRLDEVPMNPLFEGHWA